VNHALTHLNVSIAKETTWQTTLNVHSESIVSTENGAQEKLKKPEKSGLTQFVWLQVEQTIYDQTQLKDFFTECKKK